MIFRFLILSDEAENFKREIQIDADATFYDLYKAIINCTGYSEKEMASFFLCDIDWHKEQEITLVKMDTSFDEDSYTMEECVLSDYLEDEKQKLMFVFDYFTNRAFYMELSEIIPGKKLKQPVCTFSQGDAPPQVKSLEEINAEDIAADMDESFYGDESFDMDELDREGFDGLDDLPPETDNDDWY